LRTVEAEGGPLVVSRHDAAGCEPVTR